MPTFHFCCCDTIPGQKTTQDRKVLASNSCFQFQSIIIGKLKLLVLSHPQTKAETRWMHAWLPLSSLLSCSTAQTSPTARPQVKGYKDVEMEEEWRPKTQLTTVPILLLFLSPYNLFVDETQLFVELQMWIYSYNITLLSSHNSLFSGNL